MCTTSPVVELKSKKSNDNKTVGVRRNTPVVGEDIAEYMEDHIFKQERKI